MQLSLDIIYEQLQSICSISALKTENGSAALYDFPILYHASEPFEANRLYVAAAADLPRNLWLGKHVGLIVSGEPPESYASQGCAVLSMDNTVSSQVELFAHVAAIFWRFNQWESQLHQLLSKRVKLQEFLELTYPLVGNPLWVTEQNGETLAHVEENENTKYAHATAFDGYTMPLDQIVLNRDLYEK
ncbi:MAG: hypothetical protein RR053_08535, partial [Evtepia sp.]